MYSSATFTNCVQSSHFTLTLNVHNTFNPPTMCVCVCVCVANHIIALVKSHSISRKQINQIPLFATSSMHTEAQHHEMLANNLYDFLSSLIRIKCSLQSHIHHKAHSLALFPHNIYVYIYLYTYVDFFDFNEAIKPQNTPDQYHVGVRMPFHLAYVPDLAVLQQHTGVYVDEQRPLHHPKQRAAPNNNK